MDVYLNERVARLKIPAVHGNQVLLVKSRTSLLYTDGAFLSIVQSHRAFLGATKYIFRRLSKSLDSRIIFFAVKLRPFAISPFTRLFTIFRKFAIVIFISRT